MSTRIYTLPVDQTEWHVTSDATTVFNWEYDEGRDRLLTLYEKGKDKQWNTNSRLDWSISVDPESPDNMPDYYIPIYGSDMWEAMDDKAHAEFRHHMAGWMNSQFLHGEQGALICASKIVQTCPDLDSKFYAATQTMDEYVMQDEARHVAFGRLALREFYPQLTEPERAEREEFVVYACYLMRDRFLAEEVWDNLGLDGDRCKEYVESSEMMGAFRKMLFSRIVPTIKDLGLWGPEVQGAYADMGVIEFADLDPDDLSAADERIADQLDLGGGPSGNGELASATGTLSDVDPARAEEVEAMIRRGAGD
jgi:hypothetical protein